MSGNQTNPVTIDRLALHAGTMTVDEARRLAELVALALARIPLDAAPPSVAVEVSAPAGRSLEQLAGSVADAIAAALRVEAVS